MAIIIDATTSNMNCVTKGICVFLLFCVLYGSDVSASSLCCGMSGLQEDKKSECVRDVQQFFPSNELGNRNFLEAFKNNSLANFENNDNARGYFIDLIDSVGYADEARSPRGYCSHRHPESKSICYEAMYMLFADKDLNYEEEVQRISHMNESAAFRYMYLNLVYTKDSLLYYYYGGSQQSDQNEQTEEDANIVIDMNVESHTDEPLHVLDNGKRQKIGFMNGYFKHQIKMSERIAGMYKCQRKFKFVHKYCGY